MPNLPKLLTGAALAAPALFVALPAQAAEHYLGEVFAMTGHFCPEGSIEADGRLLSVRDNVALYSLLANDYGGDGQKTFAVPDLRPGKKPIPAGHIRYCIATTGDYPVRPD